MVSEILTYKQNRKTLIILLKDKSNNNYHVNFYYNCAITWKNMIHITKVWLCYKQAEIVFVVKESSGFFLVGIFNQSLNRTFKLDYINEYIFGYGR